MAGLDILGGIGKGVMMGDQFVQNRDWNAARLESVKDDMAWQREQRRLQTEERERLNQLEQIQRDFYADESLAGMSEYDKAKMLAGVMDPLLTAQERQAITGTNENLRQMGFRQALVEAATNGNVAKVDAFVKDRFPGSEVYMGKDGQFVINIAGQGTQVIDQKALLQLLAADDVKAEREAIEFQNKQDKTRSETAENNSKASLNYGRLDIELPANAAERYAGAVNKREQGKSEPSKREKNIQDAGYANARANSTRLDSVDPSRRWRPETRNPSGNGLENLFAQQQNKTPSPAQPPSGVYPKSTPVDHGQASGSGQSSDMEFDYDEKNKKFIARR